jgi:hypothetical protein
MILHVVEVIFTLCPSDLAVFSACQKQSLTALFLGRPSEASHLCISVLLDPGGNHCGKNTPRKPFGNTLFLHQSFGRNAVYKMIHILQWKS